MKILLVDDELVAQTLLRRMLEQLGHQVVPANNGMEALSIFQDDPVNVVISDWHMPQMDGIELCQAIRTVLKMGYTYFVLISATPLDVEKYAEATAQGVDDFLVKPIRPQEIAIRLLVAERIIKFTTEIKQLKTLLPICSYCKKIRNDDNYWKQIETYISETTGSFFSHGICPTCYEEIVKPELAQFTRKPGEEEATDSDSSAAAK
ncbi:MAG: response regulator [Methylacidiphilales bacterium]|nr:response regulator [Candidatus Methylacidiphilales bacterium]